MSMGFFHTLRRLRKIAEEPQLGMRDGKVVIDKRDLIELLNDWKRLDDDARALWNANQKASTTPKEN